MSRSLSILILSAKQAFDGPTRRNVVWPFVSHNISHLSLSHATEVAKKSAVRSNPGLLGVEVCAYGAFETARIIGV